MRNIAQALLVTLVVSGISGCIGSLICIKKSEDVRALLNSQLKPGDDRDKIESVLERAGLRKAEDTPEEITAYMMLKMTPDDRARYESDLSEREREKVRAILDLWSKSDDARAKFEELSNRDGYSYDGRHNNRYNIRIQDQCGRLETVIAYIYLDSSGRMSRIEVFVSYTFI